MSFTVESAAPAATARLGERLGRALAAGDVVALTGELGAGKTAFVQGVARGLGVRGAVRSPSFTIVNEHAGRLPLVHADFYRLEEPGELDEIGFADYLARGAVVVVEWADRFPGALPAERLDVRIDIVGPRARRLTFDGPAAARFGSALQ